MTGARPSDRAGGLRPEPAAQSQPVGAHPSRDAPSRHGTILGEALADLAKAGAVGDPSLLNVMCAGCAFRPGAMANQMAATLKDALDCLLSDEDFCCHHGMKDGQPTKLCAGYFAAKRAPFPVFQAALVTVAARLDTAEGPDEVRAAFDAWVVQVDPEGKLNDYQRSRLLRRDTDRSGEAGQTAKQAGPEGREPGPEQGEGIAQ